MSLEMMADTPYYIVNVILNWEHLTTFETTLAFSIKTLTIMNHVVSSLDPINPGMFHIIISQVFILWWISATRTCNWIGTILTTLNIDIQLLLLLSRVLQISITINGSIGFCQWRDGTRRVFSLVASEHAKEHANYSFFFGCSFYSFWTFVKIHYIKRD